MRRQILKAFNGEDIWEYYGYKGKSEIYKGTPLETIKDKGIFLLMNHSDCDGEFTPQECGQVAESIEKVLPEMNGYYATKAYEFVNGLKDAFKNNETLEFR